MLFADLINRTVLMPLPPPSPCERAFFLLRHWSSPFFFFFLFFLHAGVFSSILRATPAWSLLFRGEFGRKDGRPPITFFFSRNHIRPRRKSVLFSLARRLRPPLFPRGAAVDHRAELRRHPLLSFLTFSLGRPFVGGRARLPFFFLLHFLLPFFAECTSSGRSNSPGLFFFPPLLVAPPLSKGRPRNAPLFSVNVLTSPPLPQRTFPLCGSFIFCPISFPPRYRYGPPLRMRTFFSQLFSSLFPREARFPLFFFSWAMSVLPSFSRRTK